MFPAVCNVTGAKKSHGRLCPYTNVNVWHGIYVITSFDIVMKSLLSEQPVLGASVSDYNISVCIAIILPFQLKQLFAAIYMNFGSLQIKLRDRIVISGKLNNSVVINVFCLNLWSGTADIYISYQICHPNKAF